MRTDLIVTYIEELSRVLGGVRPLAQGAVLHQHYALKEYTSMVGIIRASMELSSLKMKVGYVTSDGDEATPAWVVNPTTFPIIGSPAFNALEIVMYIRKSFLAAAPYATVVFAIAHELSHVRLGAIQHPLARNEVATDLAAMILGYSEYYVEGHSWSCADYNHSCGYLSIDEALFAAELIKREYIRQYFGI